MTEASTYYNPPSDVGFDCIGEVQAPSNVEEDHMHAAYGGTNLLGSNFESLVRMKRLARRPGALDSKTLPT